MVSGEFQSTLSVRRATRRECVVSEFDDSFQSTLSVRRATRPAHRPRRRQLISIHALREESDSVNVSIATFSVISIHALREESDQQYGLRALLRQRFQSTLSVRRATEPNKLTAQNLIFQSTLSMRRATRRFSTYRVRSGISIHALREESDTLNLPEMRQSLNFNPRSP